MKHCKILTEEKLKKLLDEQLSVEEMFGLYQHFLDDCDACDDIFMHMDDQEANRLHAVFNSIIDGNSVHMLALDDTIKVEINDESTKEKTSIVSGSSSWFQSKAKNNPFAPAWFGGIAALFLVSVGVLPMLNTQQEPQRISKGVTNAQDQVQLEFATGYYQDGKLVVNRGELGKQYSNENYLFLHTDMQEKGYVYLVGYQADGSIDVLYPDNKNQHHPLNAGQHDLPGNGVSLQGMEGRYWVVSVYSDQPLDLDNEVKPTVEASIHDMVGGSQLMPDQLNIKDSILSGLHENISVDIIYFDIET